MGEVGGHAAFAPCGTAFFVASGRNAPPRRTPARAPTLGAELRMQARQGEHHRGSAQAFRTEVVWWSLTTGDSLHSRGSVELPAPSEPERSWQDCGDGNLGK